MPLDPAAPTFGGEPRRLVRGTESFRAVLTFTVESFIPGARLEIRDLVVR